MAPAIVEATLVPCCEGHAFRGVRVLGGRYLSRRGVELPEFLREVEWQMGLVLQRRGSVNNSTRRIGASDDRPHVAEREGVS